MSTSTRENQFSSTVSVTLPKLPLNFDSLHVGRYPCDVITACIINCFPIQPSTCYVKYRLISLKEIMPDGTLGAKVLPCFLYDKHVDMTRSLVRGDILTVRGFEVCENLKNVQENFYPLQVDIISTDGCVPVASLSNKKCLRFDDLNMIPKRYSGVCINGYVLQSNRLQKDESNRMVKKLILQEPLDGGKLGSLKLECILVNKTAFQNKTIKDGETIQVSGFTVEARPSTSAREEMVNYYCYHIIVQPVEDMENDLNSLVRVLKHANKTHEPELQTKRPPLYEYSYLKDLQLLGKEHSLNTQYNIYGVVVKFRIVNSNLSNYIQIDIRDPTLDTFPIYVHNHNLDTPIPDIFPYDIIRFHRVELENYHKGLQGNCRSPKDILVLSGSNPDAPPSHTSRYYTWTEQDKKRVAKLRAWSCRPAHVNGFDKNHNETEWLSTKRVKLNHANGVTSNDSPECITLDDDEGITSHGEFACHQFPGSANGTEDELSDGTSWVDGDIRSRNSPVHSDESRKSRAIATPQAQNNVPQENTQTSRKTIEAMKNMNIDERGMLVSTSEETENDATSEQTELPIINENCPSLFTFRPPEHRDINVLLNEAPARCLSPSDETLRWTPLSISVQEQVNKEPALTETKRREISVSRNVTSSISRPAGCVSKVRTAPDATSASSDVHKTDAGLDTDVREAAPAQESVDLQNYTDVLMKETETSQCMETESSREMDQDVQQDETRDIIKDDTVVSTLLDFRPQILSDPIPHAPNFISEPENKSGKISLIRDLESIELDLTCRVQARVVDMQPLPHETDRFISLLCPVCDFHTPISVGLTYMYVTGNLKMYYCPHCDPSKRGLKFLEYTFCIIFRLDDGSAVINALLYRKEAEKFLKGVQAKDCCVNGAHLLGNVGENLDRILCRKTNRDSPPLLDCCLKLVHVNSGSVFHVVDTKLL